MKNRITQLKIPKGWQRTTLGLLVDKYVGGGTPARGNPDYWGGDISWLTVKDFPNSLYVEGASEYITEIGLEESASNIVPSGALITAIRVGLGRTFVTRKQIAINQDLRGIVPSKCIIPEYLARYLNFIAPRIIASGSGSTVKGITLNQLKGFEVIYPSSKEEQKKIAEILGSVDEEIQKADEIIAATEKLKRGLMQQLFTRGIGHTKFKETKIGQIPDGWDIVQIKDAPIKIADGNYSAKYPRRDEFLENGIPFVRVNNLQDQTLIKEDLKYISAEKHANLKKGHLKTDDVLITTRGKLGIIAMVPKEFDDANINAQIVLLRADNKELQSKFLMYFLLSPGFQSQVFSGGSGSALQQLPVRVLENMYMPISTPKEQKVISEILSAVNEKISVNKKLKTKLERLKKGLMQDLLSGKVRVI